MTANKMKCDSFLYLLVAGLVGGRAVASSSDGGAILAGEYFRMALLAPRQVSAQNLQGFSGSLGGVRASAITNSGDPLRQFAVDGDTFVSFYDLVSPHWGLPVADNFSPG